MTEEYEFLDKPVVVGGLAMRMSVVKQETGKQAT
jgi:hypothetical protein